MILDIDAEKHFQRQLEAKNEILAERVETRSRILEASEARAAVYFDFAEELLLLIRVEVDGTVRFEDINPAAEAAFGRKRAEVMGQPVPAIVPPDSATNIAFYARASVKTRAPQAYQTTRFYQAGAR